MELVISRKQRIVNWRIGVNGFGFSNLGIYEESITFEYNEMGKYGRTLQLRHVVFANQWLQNIQEQGFLKKL